MTKTTPDHPERTIEPPSDIAVVAPILLLISIGSSWTPPP
jgi:hypothetical protein